MDRVNGYTGGDVVTGSHITEPSKTPMAWCRNSWATYLVPVLGPGNLLWAPDFAINPMKFGCDRKRHRPLKSTGIMCLGIRYRSF